MIYCRFLLFLAFFGAVSGYAQTAFAECTAPTRKSRRMKTEVVKKPWSAPTCTDITTPDLDIEKFRKILILADLNTYADSPFRNRSNYNGGVDIKKFTTTIDRVYLDACKSLGWSRLKTVAFAASVEGRKFGHMVGTWLLSPDDPSKFRAGVDLQTFFARLKENAIIFLKSRPPVAPEDLERWKPVVFGEDGTDGQDDEIGDARMALVESELSALAKKYAVNGFDLKFTLELRNKILATEQSIKSEVRDIGTAIAKGNLRRDFINKVETTVDVDKTGRIQFFQK